MNFGDDTVQGDSTPATERSLSLDGVRNVQINQTAGKLTVRGCREGETPGITATANKATPEISVQRDGDRLQVEIKLNKGGIFRRRQGGTTTVRLDQQASNSSGSTTATVKRKSRASPRKTCG
jgi:hypothetical protein